MRTTLRFPYKAIAIKDLSSIHVQISDLPLSLKLLSYISPSFHHLIRHHSIRHHSLFLSFVSIKTRNSIYNDLPRLCSSNSICLLRHQMAPRCGSILYISQSAATIWNNHLLNPRWRHMRVDNTAWRVKRDGLFKISFSTLWLREPKCIEFDLKVPNLSICGQSDPIWGQPDIPGMK